MSTFRRRGLVAAMKEISLESLEDQEINDTQPNIDPEVGEPQAEQVEEVVEIEFPDAGDTPEANEVEVEKAEAEMVAVEVHIDEALDIIEQVEEVADIVERGNENGGLNQTGAELLTVTLESLYSRAGIEKTQGEQYVPSLEQFGGTSSRIRAGNIALEDARERVKVIWQNILKAIQVAIQKGKEFFIQMVDQSERYKARIAKLKEIAAKVPDAVQVGAFEDARIAGNLAVGNAVPANIAQELDKIATMGQGLLTEVSIYTTEAGKKFLGLLKLSGNLTLETFTSKAQEVQEEFNKINRSNIFGNVEGKLATSDVFLGNKVIAFNFDEALEDISKVKMFVKTNEVEVRPNLNALKKNEVAPILASSQKVLDVIAQFRAKAKDNENSKAQILQAAKGLEKAEENAGDEADKSIFANYRKMITAVINAIDSSQNNYSRIALSAVGGSLAYVEKSLKAHVPQKESEAAEPVGA